MVQTPYTHPLTHRYVTGTRHKIVEIGSGTGVLGIAAAMLGCRITVTDLPHVVPQIKQNVMHLIT